MSICRQSLTNRKSKSSYYPISIRLEFERYFRKLERYERDRERERERGIQPDPELLRKLDDAESLIRRLRRENSDLRREHSIAAAAAAAASSTNNSSTYHNQTYQQNQRGGQSSRGNQRHRGNNGSGSTHYNRGNNWFPPLHTQFWQNGGRNGIERNGSNASASTENTLPTLQSNGGGHNSGQYHGRRGTNNNHYNNHNGEARKYRGGQNRSSKPS